MAKRLLNEQDLFAISPRQGRPAFQHWANICSALAKLGLQDFLAKGIIQRGVGDEPDKIIWETDLEGPIEPLESISDPARISAVKKQIAEHGAEIDRETRRLLNSNKREEQEQGYILKEIGGPPDESYVFLVGGRPVITGWGVRPDDTSVPPPDVVWPQGRTPEAGVTQVKEPDEKTVTGSGDGEYTGTAGLTGAENQGPERTTSNDRTKRRDDKLAKKKALVPFL